MAQHDEFSRNVVSVLSGIYSSSTSLGGGGILVLFHEFGVEY